jgi:uncharacterized protein (TIGR00369 family)
MTDIWQEHYRKLENMYHTGAHINAYFKPQLKIDRMEAEVVIAVRQDFFHAAGSVHGAVYFKALDDAAFFAANSIVTDVFVLTLTFQLQFTRAIRGGTMTAKGKVLQNLGHQIIAESILYDERGKEAARGSGVFVKGRTKLAADMGYR